MAQGRVFTARGLAVLGTGLLFLVGGLSLGSLLLTHIALLFLLLLAIALLSLLIPRVRGSVSRVIATDLLTVDEVSVVHLHVRLHGRHGGRARWVDTLPAAVAGHAEGTLPRPSGTRETSVSYEVRGVRRGTWSLGPLVLRTRDPFGLVESRHRLGGIREITVAPRLVTLPPLRELTGASADDGRTTSSRHGQSADNLAPRPYAPGDSMRRVHWRATASRGNLMVRQEEEHTAPSARIVLDLTPERWPLGSDPLFEDAVSACASTAVMLSDAGYLVEVTDAAGILLGFLRGFEGDRAELLAALARVHPRFGEEQPPKVASGPVIVFTGRVDHGTHPTPLPPAADALIVATDPQPGALDALQAAGWLALRLDEVMPRG